MAGDEQIVAEIDMHAAALPALGQRPDLVLHRVGQRRQPDDALRIGVAASASRKACVNAP